MIIRNEQGSVIIIAVMVLALLTIIGISSMKTSITEQQISTNHLIYNMNFYAAESGIAVGPLHAKTAQLDESWDGWPEDGIVGDYELSNGTAFDYAVYKLSDNPDPSLLPNIEVISDGTHTGRGGLARIQATFTFKPAFPIPEAPIWVWDELVIKSSAVEINPNYNLCDGESEGPEAISTLGPPPIGGVITPHKESDNCPSGGCQIEKAKGTIDMNDLGSNISKLANYVGTEMPIDLGSPEDPVVVYIDASTPININGGEGHGILFINGDIDKINGNFDWNGIVIINGGILSKVNGNVVITGALIIDKPDLDVELTGNVTINYDCELLNNIYNKFSGYRMTSWRQM